MTNTQREVERWRYLSEYRNVRKRDGIVTGVMSGNDVEWDSINTWNYVCIDCEAAYEEWLAQKGDMEEWDEEWDDIQECNGHTHLYGDWVKDDDGKYSVDENGEYGFAAIYNSNENTMQVVHSKIARWTEWCSPCYPHQGNVEEDSPLISSDRPWHPVHSPNATTLCNVARDIIRDLVMELDGAKLMACVNLLDSLLIRASIMSNNERVSLDMYSNMVGGLVIEDKHEWRMRNGYAPLETTLSSQGIVDRIAELSPTMAYEIAEMYFGVQKNVAAYSLPITSEEWELLDWMIENYKEGE